MDLLATTAGRIGQKVFSLSNYWLNLFTFAQIAIRDWWLVGGLTNRAIRQSLITQIVFTGVNALPLILLLALITAAGITMQVLGFSEELGREFNIATLISHIVVYEIAPLLTALVIISRSGSAIVVDIGNMKLRGEVEGLVLLGIDIDDFIVAPRLIAGVISQLMLAIYFAGIALYGGALLAALFYSNAHLSSFSDLFNALPLSTFALFLLKNLCFGWIICATACYHALQVGDQVTQLPQQTQKAIVRSIAHVFLLNIVFTLLV